MAKQKFKLVYVKNGKLTGSYSGIPSKDDPELILRTSLEGTTPPPVPAPTEEISITENGIADVAKFATANVNVAGQTPTGSVEITANGEHDVAGKATAVVNVPNPSTGNKDITTTAQVDVKNFATAQVKETNLAADNIKKDVSILGITGSYEGYPEPTGKAPTITENGENINIKDYAYVDVAVPASGETYEPDCVYMTDNEGKIITDTYTSSSGLLYTDPTAPEIRSVDLSQGYYYHYDGEDDFNTLGGLNAAGVYYWDGGCAYQFTELYMEADKFYKYSSNSYMTELEFGTDPEYLEVDESTTLNYCGNQYTVTRTN